MRLTTPFLALFLACAWSPSAVRAADDLVVAQSGDVTISAPELESLLYARRAMSKDGRAALKHLAQSKLLETLARERGIVVPDADVDRKIAELEKDRAARGDTRDFDTYLMKEAHLSRAQFKHFLVLARVHETLTRRALSLSDDKPVTAEQQQIWIDEELDRRGYEELAPPWKDGVAARATGVTIRPDEFLAYLRERLPTDQLREDCYQLLLQKKILARMPDLAPAKLEQACQDELARRRADTARDPRYKGIDYDRIMQSQGVLVEELVHDPAIRIGALARLWVERAYDADALQHVYQNERDLFDGQYGPAYETNVLFLRAARFKNDLNPRSFEEAEHELAEIRSRIATREELAAAAKSKSEDAATRESGGDLGFVGPKTPRQAPEIRAEIGKRLAADESSPGIVGPLRVANGVVLLWLGRRRPAPTWDVMVQNVKAELRRRFVDEVLPRAAMKCVYED